MESGNACVAIRVMDATVERPVRPTLPGIGRNWRTARNGFVVLLAAATVACISAFYAMQALRAQQTDPTKLDKNIYWERVTAELSLFCTASFVFCGLIVWYMDYLRYNFNDPTVVPVSNV